MVGIARVIALLRALALISWRDVRSLGSIAGQNIFIFILLVALQPESAVFFLLLLLVILLFPLSSDPMEKIPVERRVAWPVARWEWGVIRFVSVGLSPVVWVGAVLLVKVGWRFGAVIVVVGVCLSLIKHFGRRMSGTLPAKRPWRIPALPGAIGAVMRLQWRTMWHTLDPYFALVLLASTVLYRFFGKALDPAAPRIMALVVALAVSTEAQVLFGIDGRGAERYRQMPIRGWAILLGKDLAFLLLLVLLVWPLDLISGFFGGMAALAVGHHNSVMKPVAQERWRFTTGALFPHGFLQTVALFAVGNEVRAEGLWLAGLCLLTWVGSVAVYGGMWDRRMGQSS